MSDGLTRARATSTPRRSRRGLPWSSWCRTGSGSGSASQASPFQSPAWLLPWWTHVGQGTLASVAFRCADTGELAGFAPLYVYARPGTGERHLFPLGIATTDRLDILVRPGWRGPVARALAAHLAAHRDEWDVFEAPQLHGRRRTARRALAARVGHARSTKASRIRCCPCRRRSRPRWCRPWPTHRRRAAREGEVAYERADARTLAAWLATLERLHAQRWARRDLPGVLRGAGVMAWHRESAPRLLQAGLLRLLGLRLGGKPLAVLYVLADAPALAHRRWFYYLGGFDPEAAALSPGTLLVGHAIEQAQAEGAAVFDFLRGAEPYKRRWGATNQPMATLRLRKE